MPFGPLVTLILLIYVLFLGVIMTFWFLLSPRRKPDTEPRQRDYEAEERYEGPARAYASSNDTLRGANASRVKRSDNTATITENTEARERRLNASERVAERNSTERDAVRGRESGRTKDASTRGKREVEPKDREARDTDQTRPTQKRKSDAFEDFIRSKNDDFDF